MWAVELLTLGLDQQSQGLPTLRPPILSKRQVHGVGK